MRSLLAKFVPSKGAVTFRASSPSETVPTQGLVALDYEVAAEPRTKARLELLLNGRQAPAFSKALELTDEPRTGSLSIHGHLLPNGPVSTTLRVTAGARVLAQHDLTLQVRNEGEVARQVATSLKACAAPLVLDGPADSGLYNYADGALTAWFDRPLAEAEAHIAALAARGEVDAEEAAALRHFAERGYIVMPDAVDADHLARLNAALDDAVTQKVQGYEWGSSQRIHNLHIEYPAVRELWLHPKILRMLQLVFGEPAKACQTLSYVFGSQQENHQDTIHLTSFPAGRMCGVWTALEDVQPDSGELVVYPGSQRFPRTYMKDAGVPKVTDGDYSGLEDVVTQWTRMIRESGIKAEIYRPKAGTVLIWHENLMHAGSPRKDLAKSRRSIVGHYFAQGVVVYHDSTGMPGWLHEPERSYA